MTREKNMVIYIRKGDAEMRLLSGFLGCFLGPVLAGGTDCSSAECRDGSPPAAPFWKIWAL
jgi:hypothetical protein